MISLNHLLADGKDIGIHCPTEEDVKTLVSYIYDVYPEKRNMRVNLLNVWNDFREDTVIFPNILNCNWAMYGRLGGNASSKRAIFEFFELEMPDDLPIEQSDIPVSDLLGL